MWIGKASEGYAERYLDFAECMLRLHAVPALSSHSVLKRLSLEILLEFTQLCSSCGLFMGASLLPRTKVNDKSTMVQAFIVLSDLS